MNNYQSFNVKLLCKLVSLAMLSLAASQAGAAPLALSNVPLFLTNGGKPNVLFMMGNANSMDEDATGGAVGSSAITSKSEISRGAMKSVLLNNANAVNAGLLAYQQNASNKRFLYASQYDVSFNPADYNPAFNGARNSQTKKFRVADTGPGRAGNFIHYNVALPFYDNNATSSGYCISTTACTDAAHDFKGISPSCTVTENPVGNVGPWDAYSCYDTKANSSNTATVAGGGYSGNFLNGAFSPTTSDLGQGITDFGHLITQQFVDNSWFSNSSPGKGYLHTPLALLDAVQATKLNNKLATSRPATDANAPTNPANPLQNSGLAPLEGTLLTANNYFNNVALPAAQGGPAAAIPNSCNKNFLILLTDGLPSVTQAGAASADVAQNLADVTTQAGNLNTSAAKVKTFMVGFALPFGVNPNQLNTIAAAGGTGTAYLANDSVTLNNSFSAIFSDIARQTASASAVALNSGSLFAGSRLYQAKFTSLDWSGQLLSIASGTNGSLGATVWDAGIAINSQSAATRKILTYKPSTRAGVAFRWPAAPATPSTTELDVVQTAELDKNSTGVLDSQGSARIDYLRGSATNETGGLNFRPRNTSKLGDIVNSAPFYVGAPNVNSNDPSYVSYRSANVGRAPIIYVGANDGMLHGFKASDGTEALAYIPSSVYANLSKLTSVAYNQLSHQYFVDGSPSSADVYYSGGWHTALVSGMGSGAKGIFGLDVTDPSAFSEANAASLVNFEFPNSTIAASDANDVGYISGQIPIVKLNNGVWAAIFGNGYNSTGTGQSSIFIVNIKTGALIKKIATGVGTTATPNAMATPFALDTDGNKTADVVYAGDLQGNMWKFDISSASPAAWAVSYKLFAAPQPITQTPDVSKNPNGGYLVYFGTGKYVENADIASATSNKFYGIWDNFGATVSSGDLVQQTITSTTAQAGGTYRIVSNNSVVYTGASAKKGWMIDLPTVGERSVTDPLVRNGRVIFTTTIPSSGTCDFGGTSWLMELDYLTGGLLSSPPLDTNNDGVINASDLIVAGYSINTLSSSPTIARDRNTGAGSAGTGTAGGVAGGGAPIEFKYIERSNGVVLKVPESFNGRSGRSAWRQIPLK